LATTETVDVSLCRDEQIEQEGKFRCLVNKDKQWCVACREVVNKDATKCHHCGALQGWRRWVAGPVVISSLLLTVISIWAAEPVKRLFDSQVADIKVSFLKGDSYNTTFMLANVGTKPAGLAGVEIKTTTEEGLSTWHILDDDLKGKLINPGKAYVVKAFNGSIIPSVIPPEINEVLRARLHMKENCFLQVKYVELNGSAVTRSFPFFCQPVDLRVGGGLIKSD